MSHASKPQVDARTRRTSSMILLVGITPPAFSPWRPGDAYSQAKAEVCKKSQKYCTLLHSDVNPTGLALWIFCLIHVIVTKT